MSNRWRRVGGLAGAALPIAYLIVLFAPLPWPVRRMFFIALGPVGLLFILGLANLMRGHGDTITLQIATVFGVIGMAVLNLMAVVQAAIGARMDSSLTTPIRDGINAVHLGLDISFDIFVLAALILFAVSMWRHPVFGPALALPGALVAGATLAFNLYTFPIPPRYDLGPLVALWIGAVAVRMLTR